MIRILDAGPQTTVQDLGRTGQMRYGIPPSGPVDRFAFVLANRLVGNPDAAAALECTLIGPRFEMTEPGAIAVTGADMPVTVNGEPAAGWTTIAVKAGDVIKLGPARTGVRSYIGFAGGLDVPMVLGSRSTYLRGRVGGVDGRALRKGDELG
ncbi:MAG TPA: allophanate hydrolase, partial [Methylomirabilota bacterium]|nr:allophanate hydrolase [Methylomirabilota bacterium]